MDAQIFIVTCERDLGWLQVCLLSVAKYWTSAYPPIVVADDRCHGKMPPEAMPCRIYYVSQWSDGRRDQVVWKMMADTFVDGPAIFYLDSDCMLTEHCSAESFLVEGKCAVYCKSYASILSRDRGEFLSNRSVYEGYRRVVAECLRAESTFEFMQCFPFMFVSETIREVRERIEEVRGEPLRKVACMYPSHHFSEFNLFGAYVNAAMDPRYRFILPKNDALHPFLAYGPTKIKQFDGAHTSVESNREAIDQILKPSFGGVEFS